MCEFRIGQKVVCVDVDSGRGRWFGREKPKVGGIYTITDMMVDYEGDVVLRFAEISRCKTFGRWGYGAFRFRPLTERQYDISIFRAMCVDASKRVSAE